MLISNGEFCKRVIWHKAVVVSTSQGCKKAMRNGQKRHVFNIRIMFGRIRDDVVDVVISLPPAKAEPSQEIGN